MVIGNRTPGWRKCLPYLTACLVGAAALNMAPIAGADEKGSVLMKHDLIDMQGKQATMITVEYAPGASSAGHVHPGSVFAYVLEGAVVSQLDGEPPVTYAKGQHWYEPPKKPHVVSRNASATEPVKLLVVLITEKGEALKAPMK